MNDSRIHLVPQVVIDVGENMLKSAQPNIKDTYKLRLETIRDYCDEVLQSAHQQTNFVPPKKNSVLRKTKSQLNYSRIGRTVSYTHLTLPTIYSV